MSGLQRGILSACSIELLIAAVILAIVTLSCSAMSLPPVPVPGAISAPAPVKAQTQPANEMSMVVCDSGGLNVRETPAYDGKHAGEWLKDGDPVTVKLPGKLAPDKGLWYELTGGGWVNERYLCLK